jgi:cell division protein FtsB
MFWEWHWYLKHCHHRHTLTPIKVWRRVQRAPFQRRLFVPRRAQNLLAGCIFVGGADKSAFALLSQKVTKACACRRRKERKRFMQRTISAMVGKGSVNHNSRKFKAENVNADRSHLNIDYCNENIKKVYHELFDEALGRYNAKQTRADRKIENYYEKIRSSKQEKPFHELILQIGDKENMSAESENGQLARQVLDEYYRGFQERNSQLRVFSAHLHMDEATPHLHIDFVPFTTGSKRGLDTRVSLKQALAAQGFKGGSRGDTEWSQWVLSEKEQLASVMERYGIKWERKGTHEKHLSVLDYKKQQRTEEIERLENKITDKQTEFETLSKRIENFDKGTTALSQMQSALENAPEYQLSEPQGFMTAKSYKSKVAEPLIKRLKSLIKTLMVRCFQAIDDYQRLNQTNASLYRSNERLKSQNRQLTSDNNRLREEIKDYKLLRKVFGSRQIDSLLEQARQSKQRGTRFRNNQYER